MARPRSVDVNGDTRERILSEAARLFSELGYQGASTRAITEAVGIKQPSLFHYFAGKEAIGQELIDRRVTMSPLLSDRFDHTPDDPALDLFRLIRDETALELTMSLDTRWLFRLPPATAELFPRWETAVEVARATTAAVIGRGIESGDFTAEHPRAVLEIFDAVANESMFWSHAITVSRRIRSPRCCCVSSSPTRARSPPSSSGRRSRHRLSGRRPTSHHPTSPGDLSPRLGR